MKCLLFTVCVVVIACIITPSVSQLTATITADGLSSPATLQAGDNITLECSGSPNTLMYTYSWSTTLDDIDGNPLTTDTAMLNGFFLHGANTGTHTCTATDTQFSMTAQSSFQLTVQGVAVWYRNPAPGGLLPNNYVIAAVDTVYEIRCLSGDTSTSGTTVISPPSSAVPALMFSVVEAGLLRKAGETTVTSVTNGVYTCRYTNGGVVNELSFGVYPRSRETTTNMVIAPLTYTYNSTSLTIVCDSTNWPASSVTWRRGSSTITSTTSPTTGTYSFSQTLTDRPTSAYSNVLVVSNTSLSGLLGDYMCTVSAIRHNYVTISSASASISVSSLGPLNITIDSPDFGVTRSGFDITCNVVGMASSIVLRRDGGVVMTGTGSSLTASTDRFADGDNLGPGSYTCEAVVNGQSGVAWRFVKMKLSEPVVVLTVTSPNTPPYYAGTQLVMACSVVAQIPNEQTASAVIHRNGVPVNEAVVSSTATGVESVLTLSLLTMTADAAEYECIGWSSSNPPNVNILNSDNATSMLTVMITAPQPIVTVNATAIRLPALAPYNDVILACTAALPVSPASLTATLVFTWLMGTQDVTGSSTTSSSTTSTLTRVETTPSVFNYTCRFTVTVAGDPPYQSEAITNIVVTGPQSPAVPEAVTVLIIAHNGIFIQFTVPNITYSLETYHILYGTQMNNLNLTSSPTSGSTNFSTINQQITVAVLGLMSDTTYYYRVRATNSHGSSQTMIFDVTTQMAPPSAAPVDVSGAAVNSTSAFFTFQSPPTDQLNGVLTGFTITCTPSHSSLPTVTSTISITTGGSLTVTDLQPGAVYTCGVAANNSHGSGPPANVFILTPEELPSGPPKEFSIVDTGATNLTFSWLPPHPVDQNGNITTYSLSCRQSMGTDSTPIEQDYTGLPAGNVTLYGFRPFVQYTCSVTASNSIGEGPAATVMDMTDETAPSGPPLMFIARPQSRSVTFSWRPVDNLLQNGMILNYTITCTPLITINIPVNTEITQFSVTHQGFTPATQYSCSIVALTMVGSGPSVTLTTTTTEDVPSQPLNVAAESGTRSIIVSWQPPAEPNGVITQYTITITPLNSNSSQEFTASGSATSYTVPGLVPYQLVAITVTASTSAGKGPPSEVETKRPLPAVPGMVEGVSTRPTVNFTGLHVTIPVQPVTVAYGVITSYNVIVEEYSLGDNSQSRTVNINQNSSSETVVTFNGLMKFVPYNIFISAVNMDGEGERAVFINFTQEGTPPPPDMVTVQRRNATHMLVSWQPIPLLRARGFISSYVIRYRAVTARTRQEPLEVTAPGDSSSATIGGLDRNSQYSVTVSGSTVAGTNFSDAALVPLPAQSTGLSLVAIVVIAVVVVVGILLVTAAVLIIVCIIRKRSKYPSTITLPDLDSSNVYLEKDPTSFTSSQAAKESELEDFSVPSLDQSAERLKTIPVSLFSQHVRDLHQSRDKGFETEYQSLKVDPTASYDVAKLECNRSKNRFANIFPYDFSRVTLEPVKGIEGSDYINASYIDGYGSQNAYIAAQGPLPGTITDFWRMIWEKKIDTVVVLTKCIEAGKRKCEQYWPENVGEFVEYPNCQLSVTVVEVMPFADYEKRKMILKDLKGDQPPLTLIHWHFLGWPDHGVPNFATSLIGFIRQIRKIFRRTGPPMLVHCSAGVGRTGAFIMLDSMMEKLAVEHTINVYEALCNMRAKRVFMIQTMAQYVFVHDALDELISCGETDIHVLNLKVKLGSMHKIIPSRGITGFHDQYQLLGEVSRKPTDLDCSDGDQSYNKNKNRYPDRLPYNLTRARLRPGISQGSDYINASFLDGYKSRNAYIATQGPLSGTVEDFWKMIWEFKSKTIVMLCQTEENGVECSYQYWPSKVGQPLMSGRLVITMQSEELKNGYYVRKFSIKEDRAQSAVNIVTQLQCVCWPEHSCPTSSSTLLEMLEDVNRSQRSSGNRAITVMCNDGMGRTGTMICLHAQQERVKTEGVLDIFQCVKSARIHRQRIVADLEQYIFLHQVLADFLDKFDIYSNFKM